MVRFTSTLDGMICPKCQNMMVTVNRLGVHLEQCQACRGIFLDRGELEQIAGAEQRHYTAPPQYQPDSPRPYRDYRDSLRPYRDSPPPYRGGKRRRRNFLEELFD
jgi:uncharacterized protein